MKCTKSDPHKKAVLSMNMLGHSLINVGRSYTCIQCGLSGGKTLGSWKVKGTCKGHLAIRNGRAVYVDCPLPAPDLETGINQVDSQGNDLDKPDEVWGGETAPGGFDDSVELVSPRQGRSNTGLDSPGNSSRIPQDRRGARL
eukprot:13582802-Heterocapsa_arctica.AAC.1